METTCGVCCGQPHQGRSFLEILADSGAGERVTPYRFDRTNGRTSRRTRAPLARGHFFRQRVCTGFVSVHAQFIVPARHNLRRMLARAENARRASVVSPPPQEAALPSCHLWPHRCQPRTPTHHASSIRLLTGSSDAYVARSLNCVARSDDLQPSIPTAPQPFRSCSPGHHSRLVADGSRLPCRAQPAVLVLRRLCPSLRPEHRSAPAEFYSGHTPPLRRFTRCGRERLQATIRLQEIAHGLRFVSTKQSAFTSTWPTKPGTGLPNPEAAVAPALASVFDPEVTSLRRFTARSVRVCAVFRQAILSRCRASDFPIRNQKLGVPLPHGCSQFGTVSSESHWQALPYVFGCAFRG